MTYDSEFVARYCADGGASVDDAEMEILGPRGELGWRVRCWPGLRHGRPREYANATGLGAAGPSVASGIPALFLRTDG